MNARSPRFQLVRGTFIHSTYTIGHTQYYLVHACMYVVGSGQVNTEGVLNTRAENLGVLNTRSTTYYYGTL